MRVSSADISLRVSSSVDQITCFTPAALGGLGDVLGLLDFLLAREVLPEVGDRIDAIRARERLLQALDAVEIAADDFCASRRDGLGLVLAGVACDGARSESAVWIGEDRAHETATL
jgi:hypothetical protein